jgi:hypothetical protein
MLKKHVKDKIAKCKNAKMTRIQTHGKNARKIMQ